MSRLENGRRFFIGKFCSSSGGVGNKGLFNLNKKNRINIFLK